MERSASRQTQFTARTYRLPRQPSTLPLRDEFRRQIEARVPPPTTRSPPGLRSRADADEEVARLRREHAELKESTKVLHSVILALVQENQRLARRRRRDDGDVAPLTAHDKPPTPKR